MIREEFRMNQGLLGYSLGFKDVPKVLLMFHCRLLYTLPSRCKIFSGIPEGASLGTDLCPLLDPLDRRFLVPTVLVLSPWCSQVRTVVPCPRPRNRRFRCMDCTEGVRSGPLFWTSNFYSSGRRVVDQFYSSKIMKAETS